MKRTDGIELDQDFECTGEIIKAYVDDSTGERFIIGAATGVEEDRDGERVSKRAISKMVDQIKKGGVVLTGSHQQDWLSTFGKTVEGEIDPETDQLMIKTAIPPEGVDPIADKAWQEVNRRPLGFSIGGKLRGAFFELSEVGKKRKVLDAIDLRHVMLTENPSYTPSFAQAVAKTFTGDPAETEFKDEDVAKDTTGSWVPGGGGNSGQDSETGGKRNAGSKKPASKGMSVDDDGKDKDEPEDDDNEETVEPAERHLSCPQCGHEFAADIPVDMTPEERDDQDKRKDELEDSVPGDGSGAGSKDDGEKPGQDGKQGNDNDKDDEDEDGAKKPPKAEKSQEATMDLEKRVKDLEALVAKQAGGGEEQTDTETPSVEEVAKTAGVDDGVMKVVALATGEVDERLEKTRKEISEGFEILGNALMEVREVVSKLPVGRKSTARVLKSGREDEPEESLDEQVAKAESPVDALKLLNKAHYGIE